MICQRSHGWAAVCSVPGSASRSFPALGPLLGAGLEVWDKANRCLSVHSSAELSLETDTSQGRNRDGTWRQTQGSNLGTAHT